MRLLHATLTRKLLSIERRGLRCDKSEGKRLAVWLHMPSLSWWACSHTIHRHGGRIEAVVLIEVEVPRSWLRRYGKGLWYSVRDIPPTRFRRVWAFHEFAASLARG